MEVGEAGRCQRYVRKEEVREGEKERWWGGVVTKGRKDDGGVKKVEGRKEDGETERRRERKRKVGIISGEKK